MLKQLISKPYAHKNKSGVYFYRVANLNFKIKDQDIEKFNFLMKEYQSKSFNDLFLTLLNNEFNNKLRNKKINPPNKK